MPRILVAILCLAWASVLPPASLWARHPPSEAGLRARIEREQNPIKKAKLEVRLGGLELHEAIRAYDHHQPEQGQKLLSTFSAEMHDSWKVLNDSGRNAARKPDGFMQLEIALRENIRMLTDLRERAGYFSRGPIDECIHKLNQLHAQVLLALFPGATPPSVTHTKVRADRD